jgi:hypothetical protein
MITIQMVSEPKAPALVVNELAAIEGPLDIFCWYEGRICLPKAGADFMTEETFKPLYKLKGDAKLYLYSLCGWNFKQKIVSTRLGEAINRIDRSALECLYSSAFFEYCKKESPLTPFLREELPKKKWAKDLSENYKKISITVAKLFEGKPTLFDGIRDLDLSEAYSAMQYVEGYYLIQEAIKRRLAEGQRKVQIAFALPNDESKYYRDFPSDIPKMVELEFGREIEVHITFQFFRYGGSVGERPYIDKVGPKVSPNEISNYFNYLKV